MLRGYPRPRRGCLPLVIGLCCGQSPLPPVLLLALLKSGGLKPGLRLGHFTLIAGCAA